MKKLLLILLLLLVFMTTSLFAKPEISHDFFAVYNTSLVNGPLIGENSSYRKVPTFIVHYLFSLGNNK